MVQVLLTMSALGNVPLVKLNEQLRAPAGLLNPPPVMLTVPQPGGALVGYIEISTFGVVTFLYVPEVEPPE
jgi:hypothetical protein